MFGKPTGVVRVSLGAMSVAADVHAFVTFIQNTYCDSKSNALVATPKDMLSLGELKSDFRAVLKAAFIRRKSRQY